MNKRMRASFSAAVFAFVSITSIISSEAMAEPLKTFSTQMKSKYTLSEILDILKKEGYSVETINDNVIHLKIDGSNFLVYNNDNGDIQFNKFYKSEDNFSLRKVNKLNDVLRIGKYILDDNGGLSIELTLRSNNNGLSSAQIIQGVKDIVLLDNKARLEFSKE